MIQVSKLKMWLATLAENDYVGIDEGGLTLYSVEEPQAYVEIGGLPEEGWDL
jgi:hypothetical protein